MSGTETNLEAKWVDSSIFTQYNVSRSAVEPALASAIHESLGYLPSDGIVYEIGAGAGALRKYSGGMAINMGWIESDQNHAFLTIPRENPSPQVTATVPELPLALGSVDAIVGLGVLDTLSTEKLESTFKRAYESLHESGVLLHIMDLMPDPIAEMYNARSEGLFPLPFDGGNGDTGVCYIDPKDMPRIAEKLLGAGEPISAVRVLSSLLAEPEVYLPQMNGTPILSFLGNTILKNNVAKRSSPSWMKLFGERMASIAEQTGFEVVSNDYIEGSGYQVRSLVPGRLQAAEVICRRFGGLNPEKGSGLEVPNRVKVVSQIHSFVAKK